MKALRLIKHLLYPDWWLLRHLPSRLMSRIENAIADSETRHGGEMRLVVETTLDLLPLLGGVTARERALEVFSVARVWDTEANNGVLIYLLLADRDVEIVADRGVACRVNQDEWDAICAEMENRFRAGKYEDALRYGIRAISTRLELYFPRRMDNPNELPDKPAVL